MKFRVSGPWTFIETFCVSDYSICFSNLHLLIMSTTNIVWGTSNRNFSQYRYLRYFDKQVCWICCLYLLPLNSKKKIYSELQWKSWSIIDFEKKHEIMWSRQEHLWWDLAKNSVKEVMILKMFLKRNWRYSINFLYFHSIIHTVVYSGNILQKRRQKTLLSRQVWLCKSVGGFQEHGWYDSIRQGRQT